MTWLLRLLIPKKFIWIIFIVNLTYAISSLATILKFLSLTTSYLNASLIYVVNYASFIISGLISSRLITFVKFRHIATLICIFNLSILLTSLTQNEFLLLVLYIAMCVSYVTLNTVLVQCVINGKFDYEGNIVCNVNLISALGILVGYLLGALLRLEVSIDTILKVLSIQFSITIATMLLKLKVSLNENNELSNSIVIKKCVEKNLRKLTLSFYLSTFVAFLGIGMFFTMFIILVKKILLLHDSLIFIFSFICNLTSIIMYLKLNQLNVNAILDKLLFLALIMRFITFLMPILTLILISFEVQVVIVLTTYILLGLSWSLLKTSINTLAIKLYGVSNTCRGLGNLNIVNGLGLIIGSLTCGLLLQVNLGVKSIFIICSILILVALLIIIWSNVLKQVKNL